MMLKQIRDYLKSRFGRVIVGGTIMASSEDSRYPTFISNEGAGGLHQYNSLSDLASLAIGRMVLGMKAVVNQHNDANGNLVPRTTYALERIPQSAEFPNLIRLDRISDIPNYDISLYWKVDQAIADFDGAMDTQYAPNCDPLTGAPLLNGGNEPPSTKNGRPLILTQAQYDALEETNPDPVLINGNLIKGYWSNEFDSTKGHMWMRFRSGINSKWSNPLKVNGEGYEAGDYMENRFKWSPTQPPTPPQYFNGVLNNDPIGWSDLPTNDNQEGDKLWMTKAQKDVYQQLKSPWMPPIEVKMDPNLVRYSEDPIPNPNEVDDEDLFVNGWEPILDPSRHRFMATRQSLDGGGYTAWIMTKIAQESGEYMDYVFKEFDANLVDDILDNPSSYRPVGVTPVGWSDTPTSTDSNKLLFVSTSRKFSNGELIDRWSDPIPFTGQDIIMDFIKSSGGDEFKYDKDDNVTPDFITLTAYLYKGVNQVTPESIRWTKIYDGGVLIDEDHNPSTDNEPISTTNQLTIFPSDVDGKAIFKCVQTYQGHDYIEEYSILDISDGIDADSLVLTANSQIITKKADGSRLPASGITLRALSSNLSDEGQLKWFKRFDPAQPWVQVMSGQTPYLGDTLAVTYADFDADNEIHYRVESVDGLHDEYTIYEVPEASGGAPANIMILSNESHTVVFSEESNSISYAGAETACKVFEGAADMTGAWNFTKVDNNGIKSTLDMSNPVRPVVRITEFPLNQTSAFVTITATKKNTTPTVTISKQFSVNKIVDYIGAVILDIDSDNGGFVFTPTNRANKKLTANLYLNGRAATGTIGYKWYLDNSTTVRGSEKDFILTHDATKFSTTVRCVATHGGKDYARTITVTDVKDGKGLGIMYTTDSTTNSGYLTAIHKPADSVQYNNTADVTVNGVTWTKDSLNAVWMVTRAEGDESWSNPIRIKGERGEKGSVGNFMKNIFIRSNSYPQKPTTINYKGAGWSDMPPAGTAILWISWGEITGGHTPTDLTDDMLVGQWTDPTQINGQDGLQGPQGPKGDKGDKGDTGATGVFNYADMWEDNTWVQSTNNNGMYVWFRRTKMGFVVFYGAFTSTTSENASCMMPSLYYRPYFSHAGITRHHVAHISTNNPDTTFVKFGDGSVNAYSWNRQQGGFSGIYMGWH